MSVPVRRLINAVSLTALPLAIWGAIALTVWQWSSASAQTQSPSGPAPTNAKKLAADLGSANAVTRQAAAALLSQLNASSLEAVKKLLGTAGTGEHARHTADLLAWIERRQRKRDMLNAASVVAPRGVADFVTAFVQERQKLTEKHWTNLSTLGQGLAYTADRLEIQDYVKSADFRTDTEKTYQQETPAFDLRLVTRKAAFGAQIRNSVLVCDGTVDVKSGANTCLILANGDVHVSGPVTRCIIVTDGCLKLESQLVDSLVFVNEDVSIDGQAIDSIVLTAGQVTVRGSTEQSTIQSGTAAFSPLVRFFQTQDLGIAVEYTPEGLRVTEVAPKSSFELAGMRAGQFIERVDKRRVGVPNAFRCALNRCRARGKVEFTIRDNGRQEEKSVGLAK